MPNLKITKITNGKYNLENSLFFEYEDMKVTRNNPELKPIHLELELDKKSALEIMETLLDSENLLTKEAEDLIAELQEKIEQY